MKYAAMLSNSLKAYNQTAASPVTRLEFLAIAVFGFNTLSNHVLAQEFAFRAMEVITKLNYGFYSTYRLDNERYRWFIILLNTKFFEGRIELESGEYYQWKEDISYHQCAKLLLAKEKVKIGELEEIDFTFNEWQKFMQALEEFVDAQMKDLRYLYPPNQND